MPANNPTNVLATVSGSSVTVSWTAPADTTGLVQYRVELLRQAGYGTDQSVMTGSLATTRVMTGVPDGLYYVKVFGVDSGPSYYIATGDTAPWFPGTVNVGPRWQDQWQLKVYAFGIEPLTKPTSTSLIVGHSTRGQIGGSNLLGDLTDPWTYATDLSCYVTGVRIEHGKSAALESFGPSHCTIELEAVDDRFDPRSTSGAYCIGGRQLFRRSVPLVVCVEGVGAAVSTSTRRFLWCGWLEHATMVRAQYGELRTHTISTHDAFDRLGAYDQNALESVVGYGDTLLQRVERWLKLTNVVANAATAGTGFALSDKQYGFGGTAGNTTLQSTDMSANALSAVKQAAASVSDSSGNRGVVYVGTDGRVYAKFFGLVAVSSGGIHFNDDPISPVSYGGGNAANIARRSVQEIDDSAYKNVARFARRGSTTKTAVGASTDSVWAVEQRSDLESVDDTNVQLMADRFVAIYGKEFNAGGPTTWTHHLNPILEWSAFEFATSLAGVMAQADDSWVIGWTHDIGANKEWTTTVTTSEVP